MRECLRAWSESEKWGAECAVEGRQLDTTVELHPSNGTLLHSQAHGRNSQCSSSVSAKHLTPSTVSHFRQNPAALYHTERATTYCRLIDPVLLWCTLTVYYLLSKIILPVSKICCRKGIFFRQSVLACFFLFVSFSRSTVCSFCFCFCLSFLLLFSIACT